MCALLLAGPTGRHASWGLAIGAQSQQTIGCVEEVDRSGAVGDERGFQAQRLEQFDLEEGSGVQGGRGETGATVAGYSVPLCQYHIRDDLFVSKELQCCRPFHLTALPGFLGLSVSCLS